MESAAVRRKFLDYFKQKGHAVVPSSPVVPHDDPTLLFINAGMNQFKDVFLGKSVRPYKSATTSQKCIRVGGKHNDLENVGHTSRHLTFFEMLGNFSFGDYFKKEAIAFSWDLTLNVFGFDPKDLWATIFHEDEESFELWKAYLPEERIVRMGEVDNFWAMGDVGPCGPCSELYFDKGARYAPARNPAEDVEGRRFLEFWNLVFMEFNRGPQGELEPLPKKCVDTGAGLERVLSIQEGADSLFGTDVLRALIGAVENLCSVRYDGKNAAFHVIADHIRSLSFAIADGVQPSNIERGYVLRKVLRRAVRYGRQLGIEEPFLGRVFPTLVNKMGADFPELVTSSDRIVEILTLEEEGFLRTLKRGGNILGNIITTAHASGDQISGDDAFKLKDTYGLPLEEVLLLAKDGGLTVDIRRYEELEREAKERSRTARKVTGQTLSDSTFAAHLQQHGPSNFLGYGQLTAEGIVVGLMKEGQEVDVIHTGEEGMILLSQTPFYAEKGGQVGDQGILSSSQSLFDVVDCQSPYTDLIAHIGVVRKGEIRLGNTLTATVDSARRKKIARNHTATHLLHWALQQVLGAHVRQAGSVVDPTRLRFDFSHHKPLSMSELYQIEALVNAKVRENCPVETYELTFDEAQKRQEIKQFFGEKYGVLVRVVDIDFSKELCGGTHTRASGDIGFFKIAQERSIAAGVRRIEAVTGEEAEALARSNDELLGALERELKAQRGQLAEKIGILQEENRALAKEVTLLRKEMLAVEVENLTDHIELVNGIPFLAREAPLSPQELKELAEMVMSQTPSLALLLIAKEPQKCALLARISADLIGKGLSASDLIKAVAPVVSGRGGGKADSAQAGGTAVDKIPEALAKARAWIVEACRKHS